MILKANQKYIDMSSVRHLLATGEKNADYLTFEIAKNYHDVDLSTCDFILRAVNSAGNLIEQTLKKQPDQDNILLTWRVDEYFTAVPGVLRLEIRGILDDDLIIKFDLSDMIVRESITGEGLPDIPDTSIIQGEKGDKGDKGDPGEPGRDGADGLSAYEIAVQNGFTGSQSDWLASLRGEPGTPGRDGFPGQQGIQGEKGEKGNPGERGLQGEKGEKGDPGEPGKQGIQGIQGIPGEKGEKGESGAQGIPGENGKDGKDGKDGSNGMDGVDGFSPVVTTEQTADGAIITITDAVGVHTITLHNGLNGKDGQDGTLDGIDLTDYATISYVDSLTENLNQTAHTHVNFTALNSLSINDIDNWNLSVTKAHTHENATILDTLTADMITRWNQTADQLSNIATVLAENLTTMGVPATADENLNTLVAKVLEIPQNGTSSPVSKETLLHTLDFSNSEETLENYGDSVYIYESSAENFQTLAEIVDKWGGVASNNNFVSRTNQNYGINLSNWSETNIDTGILFTHKLNLFAGRLLFSVYASFSSWMNQTLHFHLIQAETLEQALAKALAGEYARSADYTLAGSVAQTDDIFAFGSVTAGNYYLYIDGTTKGDNSNFTYAKIEYLNY